METLTRTENYTAEAMGVTFNVTIAYTVGARQDWWEDLITVEGSEQDLTAALNKATRRMIVEEVMNQM